MMPAPLRLRALAASLVGAALACLGASADAQTNAAPPVASSRPTLVVFLTVDQMRADYLTTRFGAGLTGGLRRLRDGGALFTNAHQDHAITETAPGHASTLSGRFPAHTGIIRNAAGVQDPQSPLLAGGTTGPASPARFRGTTLVDWLHDADPRSRALSVSRKDRGAILPIGRARQSVFWYGGNGRFVTSRYYADTLPTWVRRFDGDSAGPGVAAGSVGAVAARYAGRVWEPIAPALETEPDSVPAENGGEDYTFPHRLAASPAAAARELTEFPFMDEATLAFALDGVRAMQLGAGPATDVLAVSLSSTDAVGHRYGMNSREMHDQILRLDRSLGAFLDTLFTLRDSARVVIALTADHGMQPYPSLSIPTAPRHGYAEVGPVLADARVALAGHGVSDRAFDFESGMLTLDTAALARGRVNADSTAAAMATALRRVPGVASVLLRRDLAPRAAAGDVYARRWLHMIPDDSPAAAFVSLAPLYYWGGTGYATHGSPNDGDTNVPVLFWGRAFRPGRYGEFARVVDIAPTLATALGVRMMEKIDGVVLRQAMR